MKKILFLISILFSSYVGGANLNRLAQSRLDYSSTSVTTGAWVEIVSSLGGVASAIEIFDSSGQTMQLGVGASGKEVVLLTIMPGGNGFLNFQVTPGSRLSLRAVSGTASSGENNINFYQ